MRELNNQETVNVNGGAIFLLMPALIPALIGIGKGIGYGIAAGAALYGVALGARALR